MTVQCTHKPTSDLPDSIEFVFWSLSSHSLNSLSDLILFALKLFKKIFVAFYHFDTS